MKALRKNNRQWMIPASVVALILILDIWSPELRDYTRSKDPVWQRVQEDSLRAAPWEAEKAAAEQAKTERIMEASRHGPAATYRAMFLEGDEVEELIKEKTRSMHEQIYQDMLRKEQEAASGQASAKSN